MNARHSSQDMPIELLAAYVDGELDEPARRRVECWLAEHPEWFVELVDQESLSPANDVFWQVAAPPMPTDETWDRVAAAIERAVPTPVFPHRPAEGKRRFWYLAPALALAGMAATVLIAISTVQRQRSTEHPNLPFVASAAIPDDEDVVFRIAGADDVELIHLPESAADLIVVGQHPLADVALAFASTADVQMLNYGLDDQGDFPDYRTMTGTDLPIFVAAPRKR